MIVSLQLGNLDHSGEILVVLIDDAGLPVASGWVDAGELVAALANDGVVNVMVQP